MAACTFDMRFTYVNAGWEGSASDSRILREVLLSNDPYFLIPQGGQYYVVDSGYPNEPGFLAPYRTVRYHLSEFRQDRQMRRPQELFNYRHSSLRNVIERCFGIVKARFPILKHMSRYPLEKQCRIIMACFVLHNLIKMYTNDDPLFTTWNQDVPPEDIEGQSSEGVGGQGASEYGGPSYISATTQARRAHSVSRDVIADAMWDEYVQ